MGKAGLGKGLMISKSEKDRIRKIIDTLLRAAKGDYSVRLDFSSEDDVLGPLADAVNTLLEKAGTKFSSMNQPVEDPTPDAGRYKRIIDSLEESYFEVDLKGHLLLFNGAAMRELGYTQKELLSLNFHHLMDKANAQKVYEVFHSVFVTGRPVKAFDWEILKKNGEILDVESSVALLLDDGGKPVGFRGIVRDISSRKQAERALLQSEEKYRNILENMEDIYLETDLKGNYIFFNDSFCRVLGYSREELQNINYRLIGPPERVQYIYKAFNEIYVTDRKTNFAEYELIARNGSTVYLDMSISLLRSSTGEPVGFSGFGRDITDRKRAEEALKESEQRYRMIVENVHDVIIIMDLNLKEKYRSPSVVQITGYSPEEITSIPLKEQIVPESYALVERVLAEELEKEFGEDPVDPNRSRTLELELYHKNGGTVWIEITGTFLRDNSGKPVDMLLSARDITESKKAEKEKDKLEKQLAQAQKMETVGRLAGGVAHDFNNMLSVILGYVDLAKLRLPKEHPVLKDIAEIEKAAIRSRDITRQLLAFSRKQIIEPKIIDLNELVDQTQRSLISLIGEDIDLKIIPGGNLWRVKFDPSQIEQILINLSVNARDAMLDGGKLTIETKNVVLDDSYCENHDGFTPGHYVRLSVSDDGVGMDRETLPHIYEPFFTTKETGKGTGLGLATVYGIVKQNNSFINVYSEPGYGTAFNIYVPRTTEGRETQKKSEEEPAAAGEGNILLVEDDPMVLEITKGMLESIGYGVVIAETPLDALALCEEHGASISMVITDVVMPAMSGKELRNKLAEKRPDIKVLFMSGYTADTIAHHGILDEGVHFLQKPFRLEDLARKVKEILAAD